MENMNWTKWQNREKLEKEFINICQIIMVYFIYRVDITRSTDCTQVPYVA